MSQGRSTGARRDSETEFEDPPARRRARDRVILTQPPPPRPKPPRPPDDDELIANIDALLEDHPKR